MIARDYPASPTNRTNSSSSNGHLTRTVPAVLPTLNARVPPRYSCSSSAVNQISASRTQLGAPQNIRRPEPGIRLWTWGSEISCPEDFRIVRIGLEPSVSVYRLIEGELRKVRRIANTDRIPQGVTAHRKSRRCRRGFRPWRWDFPQGRYDKHPVWYSLGPQVAPRFGSRQTLGS